MGLRKEGYGTVWDEPRRLSQGVVSMRMTTSKKDRETGNYETDFSGFITFIGKKIADKAMALKHGERIQIKDFEVTSSYDKEKKKEYINYKIYDFDPVENVRRGGSGGSRRSGGSRTSAPRKMDEHLSESFDDDYLDVSNDDLPF